MMDLPLAGLTCFGEINEGESVLDVGGEGGNGRGGKRVIHPSFGSFRFVLIYD